MQREPFLAELSARLGRPRPRVAPARAGESAAPLGLELTPTELRDRFRRELTQLGGEVVLAGSREEACAALAAELGRAERIVSWDRTELAARSGLELSALWQGLGDHVREPSARDFRAALLAADVGVTGVDYAIAETGTLVLSASVGRPRGVSLAPRLHVALVRERQLVARRSATWGHFQAEMPSALLFITGPSRTSDIENDLAIGVHGPARVLAILIPEAAG
jgi:L-lactate dehydrogenase complex protein LldG